MDYIEQTTILKKRMEQIDEVNGMVAELATESHILGINAAIEAARAKEYGLGFGVVAQEIRRLADESKQSAKNISGNVSMTNEQVAVIMELTEKVAQMGEEQSAGAQELSAAVQHINELATSLNQLSAQD